MGNDGMIPGGPEDGDDAAKMTLTGWANGCLPKGYRVHDCFNDDGEWNLWIGFDKWVYRLRWRSWPTMAAVVHDVLHVTRTRRVREVSPE